MPTLPETRAMKGTKGLVAKYAALVPRELQEATKEFDRDMVVTKSRPLSQTERDASEKARRKPGRPG
jgi:hypothetical protein